jgi:hypothetical protein
MKSNAFVLMLCLMLGLTACAVSPEPYEYEPDNELKPGSGLFSGEKGEFTIFRIPEKTNQAGDASRKEQKGDKQNESP